MKFLEIENSKKLFLEGETIEEQLWVSQLKESSKRIRKGCERYVLKAFDFWKAGRGTNNLDLRLSQAEKAIDEEVANNIAASTPDADGEAIIRCSALLHHVFNLNFKDCIKSSKKQHKDGIIVVQIVAEGLVSHGEAMTLKKAKAKAAKAFLRVVNKQARRSYKIREDSFKAN